MQIQTLDSPKHNRLGSVHTIHNLQLGHTLLISTSQGQRTGIIKYIGSTRFHHTRNVSTTEAYGTVDNTWIGVELIDGTLGKNNGTVEGLQYFTTTNNTVTGIFVRRDKIIAVNGIYINGSDVIHCATPKHNVEPNTPKSPKLRSPSVSSVSSVKSPASAVSMQSPTTARKRPSQLKTTRSQAGTDEFSTPKLKDNIDWSKRCLLVFGENIHGELGLNHNNDILKPELLSLPQQNSQFAQVSLGLHHVVALSVNNSVYTAGQWISGLLGQANIRHDVHKLTLVKALSKLKSNDYNSRIISITCADRHSVALLASGELYTWGGTLYGKLGRSRTDQSSDTPFAVCQQLRDQHIIHVDCSNHYTVVVTAVGEVYTIGQMIERNKQTVQQTDDNIPKRIDTLYSAGIKIKDVVCGGYHTLVLSTDNKLYSWGKGEFGQLGLGSDTHTTEPCHIASLQGNVVSMCAGENHSLCVLDTGEVYSWGYGGQGQLGHGSNTNEKYPKRIEYFYKHNIQVVQCAAGWRHSIVLTSTQQVYTFGHNDHGQLGHGDTKSTSIPRLVDGLPLYEIKHVAAGGNHTLISNFYFKTAQEMAAMQQIQQNSLPNSSTSIQQTPIPVSPTDSHISSAHDLHSIQSPVFDVVELPQSSYRLVCEQVYSTNIACVHRFVTFITAQQYAKSVEQALKQYCTVLYRSDPNVIFDNILCTPGSTVSCNKLARYNNNDAWNEYKYDYDGQCVRITMLVVCKINERSDNTDIHWPIWCSELLYIITQQCNDVHTSVKQAQNQPLIELSRQNDTECNIHIPCFREVRPRV